MSFQPLNAQNPADGPLRCVPALGPARRRFFRQRDEHGDGRHARAGADLAALGLCRGQPPPAAVSLADAGFDTGRPPVPESTLGGETTCIVCFSNPKSHVAGPCGHLCACGPCSARMESCPICRAPVLMWMQLRVA